MSALFHSLARTMRMCMALACILAMWHGAAAANTAKVMSVIPGVQAELDSKRTDIKLKDDIPIASTLYSDATGKARLMFPDTTCVNLAPDTELTLADFVDTEKEQNILINMVNGTAKIVTGEINRRNPDAFKVTTPHASLAIRGTMAVVQVKGNATHVHLTETSGKGVVATNLATGKSVTIRKPGTMVVISPGGIERRDSTYDELVELRGMLRHKGIGVVPTEKGRSREHETKLLPEYVASNSSSGSYDQRKNLDDARNLLRVHASSGETSPNAGYPLAEADPLYNGASSGGLGPGGGTGLSPMPGPGYNILTEILPNGLTVADIGGTFSGWARNFKLTFDVDGNANISNQKLIENTIGGQTYIGGNASFTPGGSGAFTILNMASTSKDWQADVNGNFTDEKSGTWSKRTHNPDYSKDITTTGGTFTKMK